jgi:pectinesterase
MSPPAPLPSLRDGELMRRLCCPVLLWMVLATAGFGGEKADIIVAADGKGDFRTIQEALDSASAGKSGPVVILILRGVYPEKVFIRRSRTTLVGEDREGTRIVFAELRRNWNASHDGSDWGAGVVNIDTGVTDVTLANLTVINNYGSIYGSDDHQFAVRGMGTRIMLLHCTIISDGGDAVSLWNKQDGMYYHSDCGFEGGVDYVCPRGWCHITNSTFFGHNLSASIWHDGDADPRQKFVITDSYFDGVAGFPLGRNHRDGQIFLLRCRFSANMADRPIYHPPGSKTSWQWGERHYYHDCHRDGGDYAWFADNVRDAAGSPEPDDIDARWTFDGRWDPEGTMPPVLPFASLPAPRNRAKDVPSGAVTLRWLPGRNAESQTVYYGRDLPPGNPVRSAENTVMISGMAPGTTYYWRVDTGTGDGVIPGRVWSFTTGSPAE